jgi:hypothetical protein
VGKAYFRGRGSRRAKLSFCSNSKIVPLKLIRTNASMLPLPQSGETCKILSIRFMAMFYWVEIKLSRRMFCACRSVLALRALTDVWTIMALARHTNVRPYELLLAFSLRQVDSTDLNS